MGSEGSFDRRRVVRDRHLRRSPTRFRWSHGVGNFSEQNWGDSGERHQMIPCNFEAVVIPTTDGSADAYFVSPSDGDRHPCVLLYTDAFGLRPQTAQMAERLASAGFAVLVPNVFYRWGRAPLVELPDHINGENRPALFEKLLPLMGELSAERVRRDADVFVSWLSDRPETSDGPIGVTGYCMGARLSLLTAAHLPQRVAAAAGFHGANLATDDPESPHRFAANIAAELYLGPADRDPSMPIEQIRRLDEALEAAGVRYTSEVMDGANHGYTMADTDRYSPEADERHWDALLGLLGRAL